MKPMSRQWRATRGRRDRVSSLLAKFAEIQFWLLVVGPFAFPDRLNGTWWGANAALLLLMAVGSYWYSRDRHGKEGDRT